MNNSLYLHCSKAAESHLHIKPEAPFLSTGPEKIASNMNVML